MYMLSRQSRSAVCDRLQMGAERTSRTEQIDNMQTQPDAYTLKIRGGREVDSKGKKAGKGPLVQTNLSATLGVSQDQYLIAPIFRKGCYTTGKATFMTHWSKDVCPTLQETDWKDAPVVVYQK